MVPEIPVGQPQMLKSLELPTTLIRPNQGQMPKLQIDTKDGGRVAGNARKDFEKTLGKTVVSKENYLSEPDGRTAFSGTC